MQHGKWGPMMVLLLFFGISMGGCTTTYKVMKAWEGRSINDLYFEWGKADKVESTNSGGRAHIWFFERRDDGELKTCTKTFYTQNYGRGEEIVDTAYKDCLFFTLQ